MPSRSLRAPPPFARPLAGPRRVHQAELRVLSCELEPRVFGFNRTYVLYTSPSGWLCWLVQQYAEYA